MQSAQLMQNAIKASRPSSSVTGPILHESFKKALEILEDSPTEGLFESMHVISGVTTKEELFSDYKLFERSLCRLLGDETANTILTFCMLKYYQSKNHLRFDHIPYKMPTYRQ